MVKAVDLRSTGVISAWVRTPLLALGCVPSHECRAPFVPAYRMNQPDAGGNGEQPGREKRDVKRRGEAMLVQFWHNGRRIAVAWWIVGMVV